MRSWVYIHSIVSCLASNPNSHVAIAWVITDHVTQWREVKSASVGNWNNVQTDSRSPTCTCNVILPSKLSLVIPDKREHHDHNYNKEQLRDDQPHTGEY